MICFSVVERKQTVGMRSKWMQLHLFLGNLIFEEPVASSTVRISMKASIMLHWEVTDDHGMRGERYIPHLSHRHLETIHRIHCRECA